MTQLHRFWWLDWALRGIARGALEVSAQVEEAAKNSRQKTGNFLAQLMSAEEREAFSMARYSANVWEPEAKRGLRAWEKEWFSCSLPEPPARLLVAACGTGREMAALLDQGYEVDAFDGAERALSVAKKECGHAARVVMATYRDFVAATLDGATNQLKEFTQTRYSAVLLGWGSLTHVSGPTERGRVLKACASLTDGPILTSFYSAPAAEQDQCEADRWVQRGRALGRKFGRGNGPAYVEFSHWGGFAEYLTKEELARHGAALRRHVEWDEGNSVSFPHVTLISR